MRARVLCRTGPNLHWSVGSVHDMDEDRLPAGIDLDPPSGSEDVTRRERDWAARSRWCREHLLSRSPAHDGESKIVCIRSSALADLLIRHWEKTPEESELEITVVLQHRAQRQLRVVAAVYHAPS